MAAALRTGDCSEDRQLPIAGMAPAAQAEVRKRARRRGRGDGLAIETRPVDLALRSGETGEAA